MSNPTKGAPKFGTTYATIAERLTRFRPEIKLDKYIKGGLYVGSTTLDGVSFEPKDWYELLVDLRIAKTPDGLQAFVEGNGPESPKHWAIDLSMAATIGKGFREIWRPKLSTRPLSVNDLPNRKRAAWNAGGSARFGEDPANTLDLSSLHFAVASDRCNVHIDQTGFVITGPDGQLIVDPDFGQHLVNELLWKSKAKAALPALLVDRVGIMLPSTSNDFSRVGLSADVRREKTYRLSVTASCSIRGDFECALTGSVAGEF